MSLAGCFLHLPRERVHSLADEMRAFRAGTIHPDRLPVMLQDIIEAGALADLPMRFAHAAQHCVDQGLCYYTGRRFQ
jgi:hypothetical protein